MQFKVRLVNSEGVCRVEGQGRLREVLVNEDILHPEAESVSLCFKGQNCSGIVDLSPSEIETLYDSVKSRIHLIKGLNKLSGSGARFV